MVYRCCLQEKMCRTNSALFLLISQTMPAIPIDVVSAYMVGYAAGGISYQNQNQNQNQTCIPGPSVRMPGPCPPTHDQN
ncbi:hypothetical protein PRUPE_1G295000 [Prunus persica]|uniref:Uncharacterized protein n=1 Tax=Prunus persica TaxID=3760 RepID=A0A251R7S2_PRUPE|nr:hypothetical protein PRUPE_1G295000 [Prunus persica]